MIVESSFVVEPMQWRDVPAVMAIEHRSFTLPWSASTYRHELLENANAHYFVLRRRDEPSRRLDDLLARLRRRDQAAPLIGYSGYWMILDEAHISTIAVDVGWRGHGLGELLLASLIEHATAQNAASVTLEVREGNRVAQNLYRKYGFAVTGKRLRYYQDNHENAILMTADRVNAPAYRSEFAQLTQALHVRLTQFDGRVGGARPFG